MRQALLGLLFIIAACSAYDNAPYEDEFGRTLFLLAGSAYSKTPAVCLERSFSNSTLVEVVTKPCDRFGHTCSAFIAVLHDEKAIAISFRGTNGFKQLVTEVGHITITDFVDFQGVGKVAGYFKDAFDSVWSSGLRASLNMLKKKYPSYDLWVTGHSLGGSMATLGAMYVAVNNLFDEKRMRLVTYGEPRTGDRTFSNSVNEHIPYSYRVIHLRDSIPHLPPRWYGYTHHKQEIFYPNDMTEGIEFMTCHDEEDDEDSKCSEAWSNFSIKDHLWYYNMYIHDDEDSGCPAKISMFGLFKRKFQSMRGEREIMEDIMPIIEKDQRLSRHA